MKRKERAQDTYAEDIKAAAEVAQQEKKDLYPSGRYEHAHPKGGVHMKKDQDLVGKVIKNVLGQIGHSLVAGQLTNILSIRTPADVHQAETYLQSVVQDMTYVDGVVRKMISETDPVERMKWAALLLIVSIHELGERSLKQPLNPILGETYVGKTSENTYVYCEQTSHHPPISNVLIEGSDECPYRFEGFLRLEIKIKGLFTSTHIHCPGKLRLTLPDSTKYEFECVDLFMEGLMSKEKIMTAVGTVKCFDLTNKLVSVVTFDPKKDQRYSYMSSFIFGTDVMNKDTGIAENRKDLLSVTIHKMNVEEGKDISGKDNSGIDLSDDAVLGEVVKRGAGSYLEKIIYEGDEKAIWTINDREDIKSSYVEIEESLRIPSDSTKRPDLRHLLEENFKEAETAKHELEVLQRKDKAGRIAAEKQRKAAAK